VTAAAGRRYFVTVDDLDRKGWLGHDRDSAFDGLRAAFDAALALRRDGGLRFVVAPIPAARGETVLQVGSRHCVALFPFVEGSARFGADRTPAERAELIRLLADLHGATRVALPVARRRHLDLPYRRHLETALRELDRTWTGGPFSEPVRALLAGHASELRRRLRAFDDLAGQLAAGDADLVITHGEPHAGNVLRAAADVLLVDWDTVGLAPPERDLWMVATETGDELRRYTELTGRHVEMAAIERYRLRWALDDLSCFVRDLRAPHRRTADAEHAWQALKLTVAQVAR
jgi:spectinomycin phosphotransferase